MDNAKKLMLGVIIFLFILILASLAIKNNGGIFNKPNWQWSDDWNSEQIALPPGANPDQIQPEDQVQANNFEEAQLLSQQTGKPILAVFGASWCKWCQKLDSDTLSNTKVRSAMINYVYVKIDADADQTTVRRFDVSGLPTTMIVNGDHVTKKKAGFMDVDKMLGFLG